MSAVRLISAPRAIRRPACGCFRTGRWGLAAWLAFVGFTNRASGSAPLKFVRRLKRPLHLEWNAEAAEPTIADLDRYGEARNLLMPRLALAANDDAGEQSGDQPESLMLLEQAQRFTEHCVPTGTETGPLHDKIRGPPDQFALRRRARCPPLRL